MAPAALGGQQAAETASAGRSGDGGARWEKDRAGGGGSWDSARYGGRRESESSAHRDGGRWESDGRGRDRDGSAQDRAQSAPPEASGFGGRGRGARGKGRGKGGDFGRDMRISKGLANILRHTATSLGILIRPDGYCRVADILSVGPLRSASATEEEVLAAVQSNDKKRFEVMKEAGEWYVRATQGHSIKAVDDESLLKRLDRHDPGLPTTCVHGTYRKYLDSILQKGIIPGGGFSARKHVHFAPYEPGDGRVISGMRYNCEVAIYLNLKAAVIAGVPFFMSTNEVILSPGLHGVVPPTFISRVKDLTTGQWLPTGR